MSDQHDPYASQTVRTNLARRGKMYSCRPCDGTGVVSRDGRAVYCPRCEGTTIASQGDPDARWGDRLRATWGVR